MRNMRRICSHLLFFVFTLFLGVSLAAKPVQAGPLEWLGIQFNAEKANLNMEKALTDEDVNNEKQITSEISTGLNVINLHISGQKDNGTEQASLLQKAVGPGLINTVNGGIISMYNPPASAQVYVADLLQHANIIPQAQAQGLGFASLDPILETWKQFRNIAYLFFVVIFLAIGFMIMFRAKIGQAAITVQQAIPSIIVALIAVTFSYAIAGFLIDLMYLLMFVISGLFTQEVNLVDKSIFQLIGVTFTGYWGVEGDMHEGVEILMSGLLDNTFLEGAIGAVSFLSGLAASVIVGIAILIGTFKVFFELLKSYVSIILQLVFSPIILMVEAIPGNKAFVPWLKNIFGNLMMWPVVLVCLLVNRMLTTNTAASGQIGGFMPPFLLNQGNASVFPVLVGIGILLVIPEIMKEVKKKMGVEDGVFGGLASEAIKRISEAEAGIPVAGGLAGLASGGTKSAANLLLDQNSIYNRSGGIRGIAQLDKEKRLGVLKSIKNTMVSGYENPLTGKITGGFNDSSDGWKKGAKVRTGIDRWARGDFLDAENDTGILRKMLDNQEREKDKDSRTENQRKLSRSAEIKEKLAQARKSSN